MHEHCCMKVPSLRQIKNSVVCIRTNVKRPEAFNVFFYRSGLMKKDY